MLRKTNFIKLLDKVLEVNGHIERFKNLDYSLKAKSSYIFSLKKIIEADCKNLIDIWEKGFVLGSVIGEFTKYEPNNGEFRKMEVDVMGRISANIDTFSYSFISFFDVLAQYTRFIFKINYNIEIKEEVFLNKSDGF